MRAEPILALTLATACIPETQLSGGSHKPFDTNSRDTGTPPPPPLEECNGLDDDGDGLVDEDFSDDDGDGRVDCQEQECPPLVVGVGGAIATDPTCAPSFPPVTDPWEVEVLWAAEFPELTDEENCWESFLLRTENDPGRA